VEVIIFIINFFSKHRPLQCKDNIQSTEQCSRGEDRKANGTYICWCT